MIEHFLRTFGMLQSRHISSPLPPNFELARNNPGENRDSSKTPTEDRQLVGSLLYLSITTRPDISFSSGYLSRYLDYCDDQHLQTAKRVLSYPAHIRSMGVVYLKNEEASLHAYTDSDFGTNKNDRKSVSGFVFWFSGSAVRWCSKKQPVTAQSTLEAEFIAMLFAVREAIWMRRLVRECSGTNNKAPATVLFGDNEGALNLAYTESSSEKTKHIAVKFFLCKEKVEDGTVAFNYIPSKENAADIFLKALTVQDHKHLVRVMGMPQHHHANRLKRRVADEWEC